MKNVLGLVSTLVLSTSTGCAEAPAAAPAAAPPATSPGAPSGALSIALPRAPARVTPIFLPHLRPIAEAIVWTSQGELAVIDGATGAIKQVAPTSYFGNQSDVVYNPWTSEVLIFELDDEGQTGEITSYPVLLGRSGAHLEAGVHRAWIDGEARLLPAPGGYVIFEASYGERWKVLSADGWTTRSVIAPCPASAWVTPGSGPGFTVEALSYGADQTLLRHEVSASADTLSPLTTSPLGAAPAGDPPTARMIPAAALGGALLFDVVGSDLAVRLVNGPLVAPAALAPLGKAGLRIEHVVSFDGGEVALLLLSGDSRVMAVETAPGGALKSFATLALPGVVREERRFFSHDLVALDPRCALAATSVGVFSIRMTRGGAGVRLELEPGFAGAALRGPIAAIGAHSPW
jgi:hypothetical protein